MAENQIISLGNITNLTGKGKDKMKIRSGFISNSSSSSFVIIGVKVNEKDIVGDSGEDLWEFMEDKNYDYVNFDYDGDEYVVGVRLARQDSDEVFMEEKEWDVNEVNSKVDAIKKDLGLEDLPTKIYTGTEAN